MILRAAVDEIPQISTTRLILDISKAELEARIRGVLRRAAGRAYIGSTCNPAWRWRGGLYWPSERHAAAPSTRQSHMPGHRLDWMSMEVLGSWPDAECAAMEETAIRAGQRIGGAGRLINKATDARGLDIRAHGYSFVYICTGENKNR